MITLLAKLIFWITGWKAQGPKPPFKKFVLIAAPHTSNWDFLYAVCAWTLIGMKINFLAKKQLFRFPLGLIMRFFGGIPVNRSKKGKMVEHMVEKLKTTAELGLLVPVEGTRDYVKEWKTGFYYAALGAGVPIVLGFLNYGNKTVGVMDTYFTPTGNMEEDIKSLRQYYKNIIPKHPERSSLNES
jgi:1-acyl-sn-glycerol-3-phosphate acyltransferase